MSQEQIRIAPEDRVFVLTGAGISAESGLPTFRASDGLWAGHRIEDVCTPDAWEANPELVWQFYSKRRRDAAAAEPNPAHRALAELEQAIGERFFLCTQNVDDLHERAGSRRIVHMHGELFQSRCEAASGIPGYRGSCPRPIFADSGCYESLAAIPQCACGARIRPHICFFGEIPFEMERIERELGQSTVLLVIGTSGAVHPAASFVHWASQRNRGGKMAVRTIYIGPEDPLNAAAFTAVVRGNAGAVMPGLFQVA
jgi:NAD-dependent deacetylase